MSDFDSSMAPLKEARAVVQVGAAGLADTLASLIADEPERRAMAERGRAAIRAQQGATARHAELILTLVASSKSRSRQSQRTGGEVATADR